MAFYLFYFPFVFAFSFLWFFFPFSFSVFSYCFTSTFDSSDGRYCRAPPHKQTWWLWNANLMYPMTINWLCPSNKYAAHPSQQAWANGWINRNKKRPIWLSRSAQAACFLSPAMYALVGFKLDNVKHIVDVELFRAHRLWSLRDFDHKVCYKVLWKNEKDPTQDEHYLAQILRSLGSPVHRPLLWFHAACMILTTPLFDSALKEEALLKRVPKLPQPAKDIEEPGSTTSELAQPDSEDEASCSVGISFLSASFCTVISDWSCKFLVELA